MKEGGLDDISEYMSQFDTLYEQGKMEYLMLSVNQKRIVEDVPLEKWDNPYFALKNAEQITEEKKTTVTLTVAEYGEFHNMGEYHEGIASVDEALAVFCIIGVIAK